MLAPSGVPAAESVCADAAVIVVHPAAAAPEPVCEGVRRAREFMRAHDFGVDHAFRVVVRDDFPPGGAAGELGAFDKARSEIRMVSLRAATAMSAQDPPFGVAMDERLYVSFVAHEAAHAILALDRPAASLPRVAHEYLAYVVQLATMDSLVRGRILDANPVDGFARDAEIDETYYLLAPNTFGVKAYLHFLRPGNGADFLGRLFRAAAPRPDPGR